MKKWILLFAIMALPAAAEAPKGATTLHLNATARQTVVPDTLHITLNVNTKAKTAQEVQRYINTKMAEAIKLVKRNDVRPITGLYRVYERWVNKSEDYKQRQKVWQGEQSLTIEGTDHAKVLDVAGKLQGMDFKNSNMRYSLSKDVYESFQENLMAEALKKLESRAQRFATQLGKTKVHLANINFGGSSYHQPQPKMYAARMELAVAADAAMPAPSAEAGDMDITANVSAEVWLED